MKACRIQIFLLVIIFILFAIDVAAQGDSVAVRGNSIHKYDSIKSANYQTKTHTTALDSFLIQNKYLNNATPVSLAEKQKNENGKEFLFYLLSFVILLLALFKIFYSGYLNNIFRVFFNTSLRHNQLTDLLLQSKLPSLIFNTFFIISAGLYAWLLLDHYQMLKQGNNYIFIALSILFMATIYTGKFLSLKLIGWISGMGVATDQYIFVIFLINKMIGILLIPFIILLAFAPANWLAVIIISSFCVLAIFFILRYLRSYELLQTQIKVNRFHFLLYIVGMEVIPILIIYKLVVNGLRLYL